MIVTRQDDAGHAATVAPASRELACVVAPTGAAAAQVVWTGPYPLAPKDPGGIDQREAGERLREVADLPPAGAVVLLGIQA